MGAADMSEFRMPDLGEGLTEAEVLRWLVAEGDQVRLNQPIVEVETAKAAVEVPSPYAGRVARLHCAAGEVVDVGSVIITVQTEAAPQPGAGAAAGTAGAAANPVESAASRRAQAVGERAEVLADVVPAGALIGETGANGRTATLVGYGPRSGAARRRPRTDALPPVAERRPVPQPAADPRPVRPAADRQPVPPETDRTRVPPPADPRPVLVLAKPPVRKLAKELGVDLAGLRGSGPAGTVTRSDVEAAAAPPSREPSYDPAARERRIPVKGVRRLTAQAMVASAFTAPHVTEFLQVDVTPTMELRDRVQSLPEFEGVRVTPLLFVARALLLAVRRSPGINATWTGTGDTAEIVEKDYVHLGIAAATPRGLVVPNVRDADRLTLRELAVALQDLTRTAREGRTTPEAMRDGTITITNVGAFGVDTGTPIINPGEVAILCVGAVRPMPWVHEGALAVRSVVQLSLSFDHRCVDGQLGSQVLADVGRVLADPTVALAWS